MDDQLAKPDQPADVRIERFCADDCKETRFVRRYNRTQLFCVGASACPAKTLRLAEFLVVLANGVMQGPKAPLRIRILAKGPGHGPKMLVKKRPEPESTERLVARDM